MRPHQSYRHVYFSLFLLIASIFLFMSIDGCAPKNEKLITGESPHLNTVTGVNEGLQGRWQQVCIGANEFGLSERSVADFRGDSLSQQIQVSPRGNCSNPYVEIKIAAQYSVGADYLPGMTSMDLQILNATIEAKTAQAARILNLAKACAIKDWRATQIRDVSDQVGQMGCLEKHSRNEYGVFSIEGTEIFFADGQPGASAKGRAQILDRNNYFTKL